MANSYITYPGNGSTTDFAVSFPYLDKTHIVVTVNGVTQAFTWLTSSLIRILPAPAIGSKIRIARSTPKATPLSAFSDGAALSENDLDVAVLQPLYVAAEATDIAADSNTISDATTAVAEAAMTTANSAVSTANAATATANDALAAAEAAVETADTANATAAAAAADAAEAVTTANWAAENASVHEAADLPYDNSTSGLAATNVQQAVDLIASASGIIAVTSDTVVNASSVTGSDVTDALNNLKNADAGTNLALTSGLVAVNGRVDSTDANVSGVAAGLTAANSNIATLGNRLQQWMFKSTVSAIQGLNPAGGDMLVSYPTIQMDPRSGYTWNTSTYQVWKAGTWVFDAQLYFNLNVQDGDFVTLKLMWNDWECCSFGQRMGPGSGYVRLQSPPLSVAAGDWFVVRCRIAGAATPNRLTSTDTTRSWFSGFRLPD